MSKYICAIIALTTAQLPALAQPYRYQLGDASVSGDVEWSSLGKINWKVVDWGAQNPPSPWADLTTTQWNDLFINGDPGDVSPYGDVLAYTAAGVGDVDGDGYGDYAVTWYESDKDRGDPCGNHPLPWAGPGVVDGVSTMERIGFVRVMSGNPIGGTSGYGSDCMDIDAATGNVDTLNVHNGMMENNIRRIGTPFMTTPDPHAHSDFWGAGSNDLWSHEITTVGDIDGDGNDDLMLSANRGQAGIAQIWAYTDRYNKTALLGPRWVKLIEITGTHDSDMQEEFGYQTHEGPPPDFSDVSFGRDFNNDGQPDLLIASRFYRNENMGHVVNATTGTHPHPRNASPGAAWLYMLPKADVFDEIDRVSKKACDNFHNRDGSAGSDNITDHLPLALTTEEYNVRIVGHQRWRSGEDIDYYPRYFGYGVSPAGDIDGDGELDLAVSAPFHYEQDVYADYANDMADLTGVHHSGRLYFFLSDSEVRKDATSFAELFPKHLYNPTGAQLLLSCDGVAYGYSVSERNMSVNQISFESDEADYVMEGSLESSGSSYSTRFNKSPFAGGFAAGVRLNGGSGDTDPDLVVMQLERSRFYVFEDIQSVITGYISLYGKPTATETLWDADTATWSLSQPAVVFETTDVFQVTSGTNGTDSGMTAKGVRSFDNQYDFDGDMVNDSVRYPGLNGFSIAGDQNGDGDCELFVHAQAAWDSGWTRHAVLTLDITSISSLIDLHAEYLPESFPWEDGSMMNHPNWNQSNTFNAGSSIVRTYGLSAWPVWNPGGIDDALLGVRYFPRRIEKYPSYDLQNWLSIGPPSSSLSGEDYDMNTLVPAGKAYLVRSE